MEQIDQAKRMLSKLMARLEQIVDEFPDGAVTETRSQQDEVTRLFKLRDLTAAYKDLATSAGSPGGEADVEDLGAVEEMLEE